MAGREWRWWEEFERTDPGSESTPARRWRAQRQLAVVLRWAATLGWAVLALFKALDGAWVFALVYAACAVGFFIAYGLAARKRQPPP